jgi:hypothetical protein
MGTSVDPNRIDIGPATEDELAEIVEILNYTVAASATETTNTPELSTVHQSLPANQ